ncbi:phosphoesterase [Solimonas sp. K1W22B-7]|uniref:alkaline phosphatase family protein n=1 Tax=Solimonas sp. K1W22B-7 TaxID=2303331 RepID=UPI000E3350E5|nr:alkaline phosphatase family protein [Solimonas sp. K1W22B-7]AXQ30841.1 phosphoesterase [Solimonas sp. K1W22B-7]
MRLPHPAAFFLSLSVLLVSLVACSGNGSGGGASLPKRVGHVFVIVLENKDYAKSFADDSLAPYLAKTLVAQGALLQNYYGIGHVSLDNYIAMISGQGPNLITQTDCIVFAEFAGSPPVAALNGQAVGQGCVYPSSVTSLPDQLRAKGLSWKGYMEDMGAEAGREAATCAHPAIGTVDSTQAASEQDSYATRHNPFMYFHSVIDDQAYCDERVVNLNALAADLRSAATTPAYSFITPSLCHDGHDSPCANGEPGGLESINGFLQDWVPKILASPAFRQDGLLIITFDESDGPQSDSSGCCGAGPTPNSLLPGLTGLGGGRVGAVLLSPLIKPGTVSMQPYNHYSMLRSVQDLFGLPYLGYAGASAQKSFGEDVFTVKMPELPPKT